MLFFKISPLKSNTFVVLDSHSAQAYSRSNITYQANYSPMVLDRSSQFTMLNHSFNKENLNPVAKCTTRKRKRSKSSTNGDMPNWRYVCAGCNIMYFSPQRLAGHTRGCKEYRSKKQDTAGTRLQNKRIKITEKWWNKHKHKFSDMPYQKKKKIEVATPEEQNAECLESSEEDIPKNPIICFLDSYEWDRIFDLILKTKLNNTTISNYLNGSIDNVKIPSGFMIDLISTLQISQEDVLLNIGSGIGNVVVQASCQTGCTSYGVEERTDLCVIADHIVNICKKGMKSRRIPMGEVHIRNGNILSGDFDVVVKTATVLFVNILKEEIIRDLLVKLRCLLPSGTRVVTMKELNRSYDLSLFNKFQQCRCEGESEMNSSSLDYFVYTVKNNVRSRKYETIGSYTNNYLVPKPLSGERLSAFESIIGNNVETPESTNSTKDIALP
eukprot:TRINITY_DN1302_c0_g1_i4.p1 TRINITY_DN1302_c0_g1~~TRINITY_DN1302_c0_g1_i4.p1  ORF type:complete len:440 (+),score=79.52 TRINITY_DN1302_c0_g1_i4:324-1643(+)